MSECFKWGIMGGGNISRQFAAGLESVEDARLRAVASASGKVSFPAGRVYTSYEELARDPEIQAVYIGTIHPLHLRCATLCLEQGKAVLCEKPLVINAAQCRRLLVAAKQSGAFLMEAMWTRTLPAIQALAAMVRDGRYGALTSLHLTFGERDAQGVARLYDPALGGGALLDLGVYGVSLANLLLGGSPRAVHAWSVNHEAGVDLDCAVDLDYGPAIVGMRFSVTRRYPNRAVAVFEKAEVVLPYFWRPDRLLVYPPSRPFRVEEPEALTFPFEGNGYGHEANEVQRCVGAGLAESPWMTHGDSLAVMEVLDEVRRQCGVVYPEDIGA